MIIVNILAVIVGLILVTTGILKLREGSDALVSSIAAFKVLPSGFVRPTAALLPPVEVAIGVTLVILAPGYWPWLAAALLATYTAAVVSVILRGISTDCGCFGSVMKSQANWVVVARNAVLIAMVAPACVTSVSTEPFAWPGWALLATGTLVARAHTVTRMPTMT